MRILVTGAAGFVMSAAVRELRSAGYEVVGFDIRTPNQHKNGLDVQWVTADARDTNAIRSALVNCDIFVCGAALAGGIGYCHQNGHRLFESNQQIFETALTEALNAWQNGVLSRFILVSSSLVYQHATQFPSHESDTDTLRLPTSPYARQKLLAERALRQAAGESGMPWTIVRPSNCIGPGQNQSVLNDPDRRPGDAHVAADIGTRILDGEYPVKILGDGHQVRQFTHVNDVARGIRACIENASAVNHVFNICAPEQMSILQLAEALWTRLGDHRPFAYQTLPCPPSDVRRNFGATEKAARLLGFTADTSINSAIEDVAGWIERSRAGLPATAVG